MKVTSTPIFTRSLIAAAVIAVLPMGQAQALPAVDAFGADADSLTPGGGNTNVIDLGVSGTISVTGNTGITGTLSSSGLATLDSAAVTNNATVGGTMGITGNTTVGGTMGITGNTTVGGTLAAGNTTVTG
ncbi:MAG: hypothetical protein GXP22_08395, partial [Gammaproteobacteria bacterium]|nr:hypothetical protein [Gammaproteobacteria bacterium]